MHCNSHPGHVDTKIHSVSNFALLNATLDSYRIHLVLDAVLLIAIVALPWNGFLSRGKCTTSSTIHEKCSIGISHLVDMFEL
eukprot:767860-Hanusia_phi.AAC.5